MFLRALSTTVVLTFVLTTYAYAGFWDAFKTSYKESFESSFKKSFRKSFIRSCSGKKPTQQMTDICVCAADESLEQLTVDQLQDQKYVAKYLEDIIMPVCLERHTSGQSEL